MNNFKQVNRNEAGVNLKLKVTSIKSLPYTITRTYPFISISFSTEISHQDNMSV